MVQIDNQPVRYLIRNIEMRTVIAALNRDASSYLSGDNFLLRAKNWRRDVLDLLEKGVPRDTD